MMGAMIFANYSENFKNAHGDSAIHCLPLLCEPEKLFTDYATHA